MKRLNCKSARWSSVIRTGVAVLFATATTSHATTHERIAEIVNAETHYDLFSGTVLVAKDGKIVYAEGFGEANKEYHIPIVLETRFNISSIQKTFIATVIMQLYYPECPYPTANEIQIKHLLNHTSGLGDYRDNDEYQTNADRYTCIDDVLPHVFGQEPAFAPGERPRYSNAGVLLLKGIIEKTTGMKLAEAVAQRIFEPLGMSSTSFFVGGNLLPHRATAYQLAADGTSYTRVLGEPSAYPGGGIYTTVLDMLKFDQALYTEELLSEATKTIMFTPEEANPNYANGWQVVEFGGTTVIYHGGASGGFNSSFRRYPEKGYTIVVLANYEDAAFELANKIDCMLLGLPYSLATEQDRDFRRAMTLQAYESYAEAIKVFANNCEGDSPHLPSLYQAARSRLLGEFEQEKAIEVLDRYIGLADESTSPSIAAAWWRKGVAYEQLGDVDTAIACHRKSLELDEGFELAQEALARLEAGE